MSKEMNNEKKVSWDSSRRESSLAHPGMIMWNIKKTQLLVKWNGNINLILVTNIYTGIWQCQFFNKEYLAATTGLFLWVKVNVMQKQASRRCYATPHCITQGVLNSRDPGERTRDQGTYLFRTSTCAALHWKLYLKATLIST